MLSAAQPADRAGAHIVQQCGSSGVHLDSAGARTSPFWPRPCRRTSVRQGAHRRIRRRGRWPGQASSARGVLYMLIGWVAILVARGQTSQQADQQGASQLLAGKPMA